MKFTLFFCLLAMHLINAMPKQDEEERVNDDYSEKIDIAEEPQEVAEGEMEGREKRQVDETEEVKSREKRWDNNGDSPNLDVDVNVNVNAPQKDFKAKVDVNVNINADGGGAGTDELSLCPMCGTRFYNRIIGGVDAAPGAWPWMVYLQILSDYGNYSCGGSIITRDTILTAAHCLDVNTIGFVYEVNAVVGSVDINSPSAEYIRVVEQILHNNFDKGGNIENDIALVKLEEPLTFTQYVRPVCLGVQDMLYPGRKIDITGWGLVDYDFYLKPSQLQEVTVDMIDLDTCRTLYPEYNIDDRQVCTMTEDKDACSGDSGGPMVTEEGDRFFQLGLVSFGVGCAWIDFPNVGSSIPYFKSWILENIGEVICE